MEKFAYTISPNRELDKIALTFYKGPDNTVLPVFTNTPENYLKLAKLQENDNLLLLYDATTIPRKVSDWQSDLSGEEVQLSDWHYKEPKAQIQN